MPPGWEGGRPRCPAAECDSTSRQQCVHAPVSGVCQSDSWPGGRRSFAVGEGTLGGRIARGCIPVSPAPRRDLRMRLPAMPCSRFRFPAPRDPQRHRQRNTSTASASFPPYAVYECSAQCTAGTGSEIITASQPSPPSPQVAGRHCGIFNFSQFTSPKSEAAGVDSRPETLGSRGDPTQTVSGSFELSPPGYSGRVGPHTVDALYDPRTTSTSVR